MDRSVATPTEVRRSTRRPTDRWFAGVASGLADGLDVEPWVVRLGFVVATLIGGVGVLLYAFLWWLLPLGDLPDSVAQRMAKRFPGAPTWLGVGLLVVGVMLFAGQLGWWRPSLVFAFLLIGLGVLLFRGSATEALPPPGSAQPGPSEELPAADPLPSHAACPVRGKPSPGAFPAAGRSRSVAARASSGVPSRSACSRWCG